MISSVIWQLAPLPHLLLFLCLSGVAASILLRTLFRAGAPSRPTVIVLMGTITIGLTLVLATMWSFGLLTPPPAERKFDAGTWSAEPWRRYAMANDLIRRRLEGLSQEQVHILLGEGDGSGGDEAWLLWRPEDAFNPLPPELVINYDEGGTVVEVRTEPGLNDVILGRNSVRVE